MTKRAPVVNRYPQERWSNRPSDPGFELGLSRIGVNRQSRASPFGGLFYRHVFGQVRGATQGLLRQRKTRHLPREQVPCFCCTDGESPSR